MPSKPSMPSMPSLNDDEIIQLRPVCNCCRRRVTRIILPSTSWNETGKYLFHCLISGHITPINDIEYVIQNNKQEPQKPQELLEPEVFTNGE